MLTPLIDADGKIGLPLIKPVAAAGLTTDELDENIRQAYLDAHVLSGADVDIQRIESHAAPMTPRGPLKAGEQLTVRIWDLEETGKETKLRRQIDDRGAIAIPHLAGSVEISGLSEREAAHKIAVELARRNVIVNASVELMCTGD